MLNKDMNGKMLSKEVAVALGKAKPLLEPIRHLLRANRAAIFEASRAIISVPRSYGTYCDWAVQKPSKHGFKFDARFDFWAETKKGMEGVAFINNYGEVFMPIYRDGYVVYAVHLASGRKHALDIEHLMPLFPRAVCQTLNKEQKRMFNDFQDQISNVCDARTDWLNGKGTYTQGQLDQDYTGSLTHCEQEAISELDDDMGYTTCDYDNSWATVGRRGMGGGIKDKKPNPWATRTPEGKQFITKEMLEKAMVKESVLNAQTIKSEKGTEDMTKATQVKTGMINVNKEALKQVGYLNAGRASNKLIKESVRPLLNVMFKPTFMQKIAMKLFKMENPVDVALKSGLSDLLCAQMVQAIVEIKGVENEYVREVTQAGITQAGYELSKSIPFEDAIDKVVANLEKGAEGIVAKISKK
ncbi:hypothetical protein KNV09_gp149 [Vibrio phage Athena]|uniref:Uncharacterized protein n=1 Tax=Vibrio phage Athena TaxID=2736262 RepID=A0A6M9Z4M0_9CAUD|nr:hypothetical protein KNV09_gp149 [Vibrio phage Athena]QIG66454.1 hypothetical protein CHAZLY21_163 [Vibrio phage Chazly21]QKN85780.1 hypothetical protein ATHENA_162 [Vibrio phage Athena]